jgi:hypothetical protein
MFEQNKGKSVENVERLKNQQQKRRSEKRVCEEKPTFVEKEGALMMDGRPVVEFLSANVSGQRWILLEYLALGARASWR